MNYIIPKPTTSSDTQNQDTFKDYRKDVIIDPTPKDTPNFVVPVPYDRASLPQPTVSAIKNIIPDKKHNVGIIDKSVDSIYIFNPNKQLIAREPVITGMSKGNKNIALTMGQYFKKYKTNSHADYMNYLGSSKQRVTPIGTFQIGRLKTNVAENPDLKGRLYNMLPWRKDEREKIRNDRLRDYGSQQKILTLINQYGVGQSTAIHGTDNPEREKALTSPNNLNRKLSNTCINIGDKSCVFNTLVPGSKVIVTDKNVDVPSQDLAVPFKFNPVAAKYNQTKRDMYDNIKRISPKDIGDDIVNFVSAVAEKETKNMKSLKAKAESLLPYKIAKSQGTFEINPKTFRRYLPKDYNGSTDQQVQSIINFYKANIDKAKELSHKSNHTKERLLYQLYNTGSFKIKSNVDNSQKFQEIYNKLSNL